MLLIIFSILLNLNVILYSQNNFFRVLKKNNTQNIIRESFIQRWCWMNICDYAYANDQDSSYGIIFENKTPFAPKNVNKGDTIFVTAFGIKKFFSEIHPRIKNPYILVSVFTYGEPRDYINDSKIIAWFGTNYINHPKFTSIPLGVYRDKQIYEKKEKINQIFKDLRKSPKEKLLYMNFALNPHVKERLVVYDLFKDKTFCTTGTNKPFDQFIKEMANFKFTLSPRGVVEDCYRTWEALMVGSIPVVKKSNINHLHEDLPVLIIENWEDITENFLNDKYIEMINKNYDFNKLYMKYWISKINEAKINYLKKLITNE